LKTEVLLLDTFSLFFRSHFALPVMNTQTGEPTAATYGFCSLLLKLLREHPGAELCFALDTPKATFRHEAYDEYKATREAAPTALVLQLRRLDEILRALNVPALCAPGFEADDVLATVATELRDAGRAALVVSGDRDLLQVAHGSVRVLFVGRRGKDAVIYDEAAVLARFGVPPRTLPAYMALIGDASDNLPGVPGIGPSTAAKLLAERSTCLELIGDAESFAPRIAKTLHEYARQILKNEELARLRTDAPLPAGPHHGAVTKQALGELARLFEELEFKSLLPRLAKLQS
jgi:DNA polymerase-1